MIKGNADELADQGDSLLQAFLDAESKQEVGTKIDPELMKKLSEAKAYYEAALNENSQHLRSLINITQLLLCWKKNVQAIPYFDRILALDPRNSMVLYSYLSLCYMVADYSKTIDLANKLLVIDQHHVDAILFKGRALLMRGEQDDYTNAARCLELLPEDPFANCYGILADLFVNRSDRKFRTSLEEKIVKCIQITKEFKDVQYQDPKTSSEQKDLRFCYDLATLSRDLYSHKKGDKDLMLQIERCSEEKEQELSGEQQELFLWQGIYLRIVHDSDNALRCFEVILKRAANPCPHSLIQRGIIFFSQKEIEKAFRNFNTVNPSNARVKKYLAQIWLQRARNCRTLSNFSRELAFLREAHGLDPNNPTIANELKRAEISVAERNKIIRKMQGKEESKSKEGFGEDHPFSVTLTPPPEAIPTIAPGASAELLPALDPDRSEVDTANYAALVADAATPSPGDWPRAPSSLEHIPAPSVVSQMPIPTPKTDEVVTFIAEGELAEAPAPLPGQPNIASPTANQTPSSNPSARAERASVSDLKLEASEGADITNGNQAGEGNSGKQELPTLTEKNIPAPCICVLL